MNPCSKESYGFCSREDITFQQEGCSLLGGGNRDIWFSRGLFPLTGQSWFTALLSPLALFFSPTSSNTENPNHVRHLWGIPLGSGLPYDCQVLKWQVKLWLSWGFTSAHSTPNTSNNSPLSNWWIMFVFLCPPQKRLWLSKANRSAYFYFSHWPCRYHT